jgi:hypothetical protein
VTRYLFGTLHIIDIITDSMRKSINHTKHLDLRHHLRHNDDTTTARPWT